MSLPKPNECFIIIFSNAEGMSEPEEEEENAIVKAVTVKFARRENERTKKAREKSSYFQAAKAQEEPWIETQYCDMDSKESTVCRNWKSG